MKESFSSTFCEARQKFLEASIAAGAQLSEYGHHDVVGRDGEYLACDVAVVGDPSATAAAVVISGTHGSEGYCGSAIFHRWLITGAVASADTRVKVVLVHGINPWAFSHKTRANENNVDLNRNFLPAESGFSRPNPSYDQLAPFLHGIAGDASEHLAAYRAYLEFLRENGRHLETQSWEGQSTWPDGIFYTGTQPSWSNVIFRRIVTEHLSSASKIGFIDWHTGIGQYGEVVPLIFDAHDSDEYAAAATWWELRHGGKEAFRTGTTPKYDGLLCSAIRQELPTTRIAGAVIEFGIADDYTIFRADRLDRWLRFEGRTDPDHDQLREDYLKLCCPNDVAWRRFVLSTGPGLIDQMVSGVHDWR
jgi:hypothetical protein